MEVYGEKPKRFSQKWWENYFYYYKVHTIVAIGIIIVGGYLVYSDLTATKYDLQIDYISELGIAQNQIEVIEELAEGKISDVTGNDICDAFAMTIDMGETKDMQYAQAMQVKYMTEMGYSDAFVFIASKKYVDEMSGSGVFEKSSAWTASGDDSEFVSLAGCKALEETGMPLDQLYVAVRKLRDKELGDVKKEAEHQNGIDFAVSLIDER